MQEKIWQKAKKTPSLKKEHTMCTSFYDRSDVCGVLTSYSDGWGDISWLLRQHRSHRGHFLSLNIYQPAKTAARRNMTGTRAEPKIPFYCNSLESNLCFFGSFDTNRSSVAAQTIQPAGCCRGGLGPWEKTERPGVGPSLFSQLTLCAVCSHE